MARDGTYERRRQGGGLTTRVLCTTCNNNQCSVYAAAYCRVHAHLVAAPAIYDDAGRRVARLEGLFPLRFVKHCISMVLCATAWEPNAAWTHLQEFVLEPASLLPSDAPRLFLYWNRSRLGRIVPSLGITQFSTHETSVVSEITWPPLGMVAAFMPLRRADGMQDITDWGQTGYDETRTVTFALPEYAVEAPFPVTFGSEQEVGRMQVEFGEVYVGHVPVAGSGPLLISSLIERIES